MPPKACIVVLNWNGARDTIACLGSLRVALPPSVAVLVVDNGSTDGSPERIREAFPDIEMLCLPRNLGYAAGNNAGFRRAMEMQAEMVVFLNNDTMAEGDFCTPLIRVLEGDPEVGIAVSKICYFHDPSRIWYAGGEARLSTGLVRHVGIRRKDGAEFSRPGPTGYATGCCLAMRCRDFRRAGGFDEEFGMYAEDVDLSLRVKAMGLRIEYVPYSKILHRVSSSLGGNTIEKFCRKNSALFRLFRKHRAWGAMFLYPLLLPLRLVFGALGEALAAARPGIMPGGKSDER
jgi:GT2 family glycosyltransferase